MIDAKNKNKELTLEQLQGILAFKSSCDTVSKKFDAIKKPRY